MNILVTGGAGGIGSTLCIDLVRKGHTVYALDNLSNGYRENLIEDGEQVCELFVEDIRVTSLVRQIIESHHIEYIIHLAAITALPVCETFPYNCINVNVAGTSSVISAARHSGAKVIFASTSAIYENCDKSLAPFKESISVEPKLMYPISKKLGEDIVDAFKQNYGMGITTLRFFNVFGPRQDIHRKTPPLMNYIVREVKNNRPLEFFSDGKQVRDYVHVNDVVKLIELCMTNEAALGETFNVCTSTLTSVRDIISYAEEAFGKSFIHTFNEPKDYWKNYPDIHFGKNHLDKNVIAKEVNKFALGSYEKAHSILGWNPNTDIRTLMIESMRENYNRYS